MKELEDLSWFPSLLRNFQTEFIGFVVARFNVYDVFIQHLRAFPLPLRSMTDLCSGSGEPAITIYNQSKRFSSLSLSDKYPNRSKLGDEKAPYKILVKDVLAMDFKQGTYYTMFNAFHHFRDAEKLSIVQHIQASGSGAFIVEILEPKLFCFLKVIFATTIGSVILTPLIRPFSFKRLIYTYILPVNILAITYDGIVSVLKSRSVKQYQNLMANEGNVIKVFRLKSRFNALIVIQIEQGK